MPTNADVASPSALAMQAQVVAIRADRINARVFYRQTTGGKPILIDSTAKLEKNSTGGVGWTGTRGFPFEFDLAPCLLDKTHVVAGSGCLIGIAVRLLEGNVLRDSIAVDDVQVEPGRVTTITRTVILREIQSVFVIMAEPSVDVGAALSLGTRIVDVSGTTLTDRAVAWHVDAPAIARVSSDGVVTGISPGETWVAARVGGREGTVRVVVKAHAP